MNQTDNLLGLRAELELIGLSTNSVAQKFLKDLADHRVIYSSFPVYDIELKQGTTTLIHQFLLLLLFLKFLSRFLIINLFLFLSLFTVLFVPNFVNHGHFHYLYHVSVPKVQNTGVNSQNLKSGPLICW